MSYCVRRRFHHPDTSRNKFYEIGDIIGQDDEYELRQSGLLAKNCVSISDPVFMPNPTNVQE